MSTKNITERERLFSSLNKMECPFCKGEVTSKYLNEDIEQKRSVVEYKYICGLSIKERRETVYVSNELRNIYQFEITQVCDCQESFLIEFLKMKKKLEEKE